MLNKIEKFNSPQPYEKVNYFDLANELFSKINEIIDVVNNLPNEIIEMLRCPACGGKKYTETKEPLFDNPEPNMIGLSVDRVRDWERQIEHGMYLIKKTPCPTCNGTGIRLPEKAKQVEDSTNFVRIGKGCFDCRFLKIDQSGQDKFCKLEKEIICPANNFESWLPNEKEVEEKNCKNCRHLCKPINHPCNLCTADMDYPMWQPKEQEDLTDIKLSKEDFQQIQESIENPQYNEKLAEALKKHSQKQSEDSQIDLIAKYILQNYQEEITEGGAGEVAIKIIEKLQAQLREKDNQIENISIEQYKRNIKIIAHGQKKVAELKLAEKDKQIERLQNANQNMIDEINANHKEIEELRKEKINYTSLKDRYKEFCKSVENVIFAFEHDTVPEFFVISLKKSLKKMNKKLERQK